MTGLFMLLTILAGVLAQGFVSERLIGFRDACGDGGQHPNAQRAV